MSDNNATRPVASGKLAKRESAGADKQEEKS
jgi:hypothetical protein